jgi:hypothetical protein
LAASSALSASATLDNVKIEIEGAISPTKLPRKAPVPITLKLSGAIKTTDGSHVPAEKTLALEFDLHGSLYTKCLPACTAGKLESTLSAKAKRICGNALVGTDTASAEIAFPGQPAFDASGLLLTCNGQPKAGEPVLLIHVHANVSAPTTFVTTASISKASGR